MLTYMHIYKDIAYIYRRCAKKEKVLCIIQYKFNVLVNIPIVFINTNYTLLASSSATYMISQDCRSDTNMTDGMAGDDTSGKKRLCKNFIYNEFTYTSSDIEQKGRNVKKYSSHILKYMNIY